MFTRLLESRRTRTWPLAGTAWSVAAHALGVAALVVHLTARDAPAAAVSTPTPATSERLHWIGLVGAAHAPAPTRRASSRGPIAFATARRTGWGRRHGRTSASPRFTLPDIPQIDVSMVVVSGLAASAPDFARLVARVSEWLGPARPDTASWLSLVSARPAGAATDEDEDGRMPIAMVTNPRPTYPPMLLHAGIGGRVVVRFVIDSTGVPDVHSLCVVRSTDRAFLHAVRDVLPRLRFVPARVADHAVPLLVQQPFDFVPPSADAARPFVP